MHNPKTASIEIKSRLDTILSSRHAGLELRQESYQAAPETAVGRRLPMSQQDSIQAQTASRSLNQEHDLDNNEEEVRPRPLGGGAI
jgi:hypothetical protein